MHYVKQFHINGVDTKQVACIELHGAPNAATEGAVGVLGMDITSPTHEVYKCVAVNGSVYTWELLSAGMSIMSSTITGEGGLTKEFPYNTLLAPNGYLIKTGDLILDSEGYLYRVKSIASESCDTEYCGTHIGGIASGDKDYTLTVKDGQLQLVTESGAVVSEVELVFPDDRTIFRDDNTGKAHIMGVETVNDQLLHFFVGTKAEYDALTEERKKKLLAIVTDDMVKEDVNTKLRQYEAAGRQFTSGCNHIIYDYSLTEQWGLELSYLIRPEKTVDDIIGLGVSGIVRVKNDDGTFDLAIDFFATPSCKTQGDWLFSGIHWHSNKVFGLEFALYIDSDKKLYYRAVSSACYDITKGLSSTVREITVNNLNIFYK